jgi:hypothetical protein
MLGKAIYRGSIMSRRMIRMAIFLVFLIASITLGFAWHHAASEDKKSTLPKVNVPLYIDAWTSQPALPVTIQILLSAKALGSLTTNATVTVEPTSKNISVAITSSLPSSECLFGTQEIPPSGLPTSGLGVQPYGYRAAAGTGVFCSFQLNDDSITYDGEVIQAKLPVVSDEILTIRRGAAAKGLGGEVEADGITYKFATDLNASEVVSDLGARVTGDDDDLVTNFPSSGTTDGYAFSWQGGIDLAPELRAVAHDLEDHSENDDFLSGIAFAIAAAAAVALAQEIPDKESGDHREKSDESHDGTAET